MLLRIERCPLREVPSPAGSDAIHDGVSQIWALSSPHTWPSSPLLPATNQLLQRETTAQRRNAFGLAKRIPLLIDAEPRYEAWRLELVKMGFVHSDLDF